MAENDDPNNRQRRLLDDLVARANEPRSVVARYRIVTDPSTWNAPDDLLDILGLPKESLTALGQEVLDLHETKSKDLDSDWCNFKWQLTAFHEIQDVFDAPLYAGRESKLNIFHLWYFYYESRHLLTESILSGLQGLYAASNTLLRIFLEFSVLQLYYYTVSHEQQSYDKLERYFRTGIHPSWHTALQKAVSSDSFCKTIKMRLDFHFKGLSKSAAHSYHPTFSPRQHSSGPGHLSAEGIYFWQLTRVVLQAVLWAYVVKFPMLLRPCDVVRKFGFDPPVGLFVSEKCSAAIKKSLGELDYPKFLQYAEQDENAKTLLEWFNSFGDLTDEEITRTWNRAEDGELKRIYPEGYAKTITKLRAMRETMAMVSPTWDKNKDLDIDDIDMFSYETWRSILQRSRS